MRGAALGATLALVLTPILALPRAGHAQEAGTDYDVSVAADGAITGGLLAGSLLVTLIPVDTSKRWSSELFGGWDDAVKAELSSSAAALSDGLLAATMIAPVLLQLPGGWNRDTGDRLLLYGQAVSANLFVNGVVKYLVQRPRPYTYHLDERVRDHVARTGKDSHLSFYSGHSSTGFTAAVAGAYLFASGAADDEIKATVWLLQLTLASTTANLRVRAGKHFYSDVLVGAVVGSAIGFAVPALHADGAVYRPSGLEWGAMAAGVVLGTLAGQLLPFDKSVSVPVAGVRDLRMVPMAHEHATGISLAGWF